MEILCPIGARGGPDQIRRLVGLLGQGHTLTLVHVIDERPRHDLELLGGPMRHGPRGGHERREQLSEIEERAGQDTLDEALAEAVRLGIRAVTHLERGRPEHVIVALVRRLNSDLIVVGAREAFDGHHPPHGPASVGHTARFVLDHAPVPALLLR